MANNPPRQSGWQDRSLLEGPQTRRRDLSLVLRSVSDFVSGFRALSFVGPCVTVFGSARFGEGHPYYELGRQVGSALSHLGFTVMTVYGWPVVRARNMGRDRPKPSSGGKTSATAGMIP